MKKIFPFLNWLPLVRQSWKDDLIAGITGTIVVIPMAVAFAMIAGLPPVYGFYTAMTAPIIAALFGSSYHLISGPTTTSSIVVFAIVSKFVNPESDLEAYISLTIVLSFMTGVIKMLMGLARLGKLVNFVSYSVVIGFTAGAGILIAIKQLKHVFGIAVPLGSNVSETVIYIGGHMEEARWNVVVVALFTFVIAICIKKFIKPISRLNMLLAMILGSLLAILMGGPEQGIETVGHIPSHLPPFRIPDFGIDKMVSLSSGAITLALLGLIEAVSIARSISLQTQQKLENNKEFIGQGLTNMISSFFSSYASSGSFTRSSINYQAGAKTPLSAIVAGIGLILVILFLAPYASFLPKAAMGGIILLVGYNLVDIKHIRQIIKSSKREVLILSVTFLGTLFLELEVALFSGIVLSLFFYLEKTSKPNIAIFGKNSENKFINVIRDDSTRECPKIKIIRIDGSIYFGAVEGISDFFANLYDENEQHHLMILAQGINFIDLAGAEWLAKEAMKWKDRGGGIYFVGLKLVSQDVLRKGGFLKEIGQHHFFKDKNSAIKYVYKQLGQKACEACEIKLFEECQE